MRLVMCLCVALALGYFAVSCEARLPKDAQYFPVERGYQWTYRDEVIVKGDTALATSTVAIDTTYSEKGKLYFWQSSEVAIENTPLPMVWTLGFIDETGVYNVCTYSLLAGTQTFAAPTTILSFPLKMGTTWKAEDKLGTTEYTVTAVEKVKAGKYVFPQSVRITVVFEITDEGMSWCEQNYGARPPSRKAKGYSWYSKNIGLIKISMNFGSFTVKRELMRFGSSQE